MSSMPPSSAPTPADSPAGRTSPKAPRGLRRAAVFAVALLTGLATFAAGPALAAQAEDSGWEPQTPPLTTPWTDDVSPTNTHEKYPRPQLKRSRWRNLNGVWQFAAAEGESPPAAHVTGLGTTPDLSPGSPADTSPDSSGKVTDATLRLNVHAKGVTDERVVATAYAGDEQVGRVSGPANAELQLPVPDPKLWSPKNPYLYDLDVKLVDSHPGDGRGGQIGRAHV